MLRHPGPLSFPAGAWLRLGINTVAHQCPGQYSGGVSSTGRTPASGKSAALGTADPARERLLGVVYTFSAYVLWGFLPLYFLALAPTGPWEVVGLRVVFSIIFCLVLLTLLRAWPRFLAVARNRRSLVLTAVAGVLVYVNWQIFLIGTLSGNVLETSLGYFINPLFTVLLAVLVLRERLRITQWIALGIAGVAVAVIIVGYGTFPWIALSLAASFSLYGLVKNRLGPSVDAVSGLTLETFWLLPIAIVQLVIVQLTTGLTFGTGPAWHTLLLCLAGIVTMTPLLFFAAGARRIPLTFVGMLQFIAPIMQFIVGAWLLHEPMPIGRWFGFGLVWAALAVLTIDSILAMRRARRAALAGRDADASATAAAQLRAGRPSAGVSDVGPMV